MLVLLGRTCSSPLGTIAVDLIFQDCPKMISVPHAVHAPILAFERSLFGRKRVRMGKVIWEHSNPKTGSGGVCKMIGKNLVVWDQNNNKNLCTFVCFCFDTGCLCVILMALNLCPYCVRLPSSGVTGAGCRAGLAAARVRGWRNLPLFPCCLCFTSVASGLA